MIPFPCLVLSTIIQVSIESIIKHFVLSIIILPQKHIMAHSKMERSHKFGERKEARWHGVYLNFFPVSATFLYSKNHFRLLIPSRLEAIYSSSCLQEVACSNPTKANVGTTRGFAQSLTPEA